MYIRFLQFRSSLLSESLLLSFPLPTKIFQFDRYCLHLWIHALLTCGFSHSDSSGSLLTYSSPKRFAVRRVLLRLLVPRHPLCALYSLTFFLILIRLNFYLLFKDLFLRNISLSKLYTTNKLIFYLVVYLFVHPVLLRKEVIHPHVLVGIPCYDLTPIICPTLDGSFLIG